MYIVILIVITSIILLLLLSQKNKAEHFWEPKWHGEESQDCYTEKPENCLKFSNCGFCSNQCDKCIPGDKDGPFYRGNCGKWLYSNYGDRHIFNEKVTSVTSPWDRFYPGYEATFPSPVSWSAL